MKRVSSVLLAIGIVTALSGYLRELALALTFGVGPVTDAFFVALSMPMVIGDLIIGSVLTAIVVPVFTKGMVGGEKACNEIGGVFCALLISTVAASLVAAAVIVSMAEELIALLAPGLDDGSRQAAKHYLHWLVWILPLNGIVVLVCQTLNSMRVFVVPACTGLTVNLSFFLCVLLLSHTLGAWSLAVAVIVGPAIMSAVLLHPLARLGLPGTLKPAFRTPRFRQAVKLGLPVLSTLGIGSGLGLLMISHVVLRKYGSEFGEGVISALSYAFRIYQVPMTLVMSTVGVLVLPAVSRLHASGRSESVLATCRELLAWGALILLPAAAIMHAEADVLVRIMFQYGRFDDESAKLTADALRAFALAIPFEGVLITFFRVVYALHRPGISVLVGTTTITALFVILESLSSSGILSLSLLPYCLVGAFALGAVACLCGVGTILHVPVHPPFKELSTAFVLASAVAAVLTKWEEHNVAHSFAWSIGGVITAACVYVLLVLLVLPWRRRALVALVSSSASDT